MTISLRGNDVRLRAAVVGLGKVGSEYPSLGGDDRRARTHVEAILKCGGYDLTAACDVSHEKRRGFRSRWELDIPVYASASELLQSGAYDVVGVAVPTDVQYRTLCEILDHDIKAIFCEKPFCSNTWEERDICRRAALCGIEIAVNYHRRWDPRLRRLKEYLHENGTPATVEVVYRKGLYNYGSHIIDFLMAHFGEVSSVQAFILDAAAVPSADPSISALLEFASGMRGLLRGIDAVEYELIDFSLYYRRRKVDLGMGGYAVKVFEPREHAAYEGYASLVEVESAFEDAPVCGLVEAYAYIGECVRAGSRIENGSAQNAVKVMAVIEAMKKSAAEGARITI